MSTATLLHEKPLFPAQTPDFSTIIFGNTPSMLSIIDKIKRIAVTDHPVLITGETGSGKEVAATLIRQLSKQKEAPFIDLNCGAIPEALIESQLFGHTKGAFTGAVSKQEGYFSTVGRGTLFLDEIGELTLSQQTKLLRVLETRTFRPVGSSKNQSFKGRVIAATHHDLEQMVADNRFRKDLFYRLNIFHIEMPPLRERREDIPALVALFSSQQRQPFSFRKDAIDALVQADWPGNIRQLKHTIEKIAVLCDEVPVSRESVLGYIEKPVTEIEDVLESIASNIINLDLGNKIAAIESSMIKKAMNECEGNKSKAAKLLGVHRKYIERKLKAFDEELQSVFTLIQEGKQEMSHSHYESAIKCYQKATALLKSYSGSVKLDELRLELLIKISVCIRTLSGWNDPELNAIYAKAEKLGKRLNKIDEITTVQFGVWVKHLMNLELDKGLEAAESLLTAGKEINSPFVISQAYIAYANISFWRGEFLQTQKYLSDFVALYQHENTLYIDGGQNPYLFYLMFQSLNSFHLGKIGKAKALLRDLLSYASEIDHPFTTVIALQTGTWLEYLLGNLDASFRYASQMITICEENSFVFYEGLAMIFRGVWIADNMNRDTGIEEIKKGYKEKMMRNGGCAFNSMFAITLGHVYLQQKEYRKGSELVDSAIAFAKEKHELCYLSDLVMLRGALSLLAEDVNRAEAEFKKAQLMALQTGSPTSELKAALALAELYTARGEHQETEMVLRPVIANFAVDESYAALDKARQELQNIEGIRKCQKIEFIKKETLQPCTNGGYQSDRVKQM